MKSTKIIITLFILTWMIIPSCKTSKSASNPSKGRGIDLFTIQQDRDLGAQVAAQIDGDPAHYPLLDSVKYKDVYTYLYKVRDNILNSGKVDLKNDFKWRLRVIHDDSTLNAFCTPGGYIYVYTGILKFLDSEDQLAGVLGHEIGHADMRHSTRQMTTMYGVQFIEQILLGNHAQLEQLTTALVGLKFSRAHESEADGRSVLYLCPTQYKADGAAGFFIKINAMGQGQKVPEFLSTHPNPSNRIEHFQNSKITLGCTGDKEFKDEYKKMVTLLPK